MKRILIIQLARFGDVMQTAPLASAFNRECPDGEFHLLIDAAVEPAARLIDGVAKIHVFDRAAFSRELLTGDLIGAYRRGATLAMELERLDFDSVHNITHTAESACLTALSDATHLSGMTAGRIGPYSAGAWSRLFRAILPRRAEGAFHLVDLHLKLAGLKTAAKHESWLRSPLKFPPGIDAGSPFLTIQLGANDPLRMWEVASFVRTARLVKHSLQHINIVLVGASPETHLGGEFERLFDGKVINLIGRTDLEQLAGVVACSSLVLGGDTGTLHLAAALNVPVIGVFLGMARADDTAPYREGSVIFEPVRDCAPCAEGNRCGHISCQGDVPPEIVASTVIDCLRGDRIEPENGISWRRRVATFDEDDCLLLSGPLPTEQDALRRARRRFWLNEFEKEGSHYGVMPNGFSAGNLAVLATEALRATREFDAALASGRSAGEARDDLTCKLAPLERLSRVGDSEGLLAHLFQLELENLQGGPREVTMKVLNALEVLHRRTTHYPTGVGLMPIPLSAVAL